MRTIAHVDMDCFFAAVEAYDHPEYRGRPIIVGGPRGGARSVVSTCSYEARKYGVRSAMPLATAERLCPHAVFVRGNMKRYAEVSEVIMNTLAKLAPVMEQVSIDEAFLDMSGCERLYQGLHAMGEGIKRAILDSSGLTASVGIAPNKFLAKLASSRSKPDGLLVLTEDQVDSFLEPLAVGDLWGVGEKGSQALARFGIATVKDLRAWPQEWLVERFGKWGAQLYRLARGIDDSPVCPDWERQSYASEHTFDSDVADLNVLRRAIARHSARVGRRLRSAGLLARTVTLKVKFADFKQISRGRSLPEPFDDDDTVYSTACSILDDLGDMPPVRLIGVCLSGLTDQRQLSLFESASEAAPERRKADQVLDAITSKHGARLVVRGRELEH